MYVFLLLLSAITTATGLFAVGFGLAPYEGSLGNALVMAGSVAVVGGMILFGLAAAVRQLRRIADAVGPRPAPVRRPAAADSAEAAGPRPAAAARVPYPARPVAEARETRTDARAGEARPPVTPPAEAPDIPLERPRPAAARSEPPMVEEHETVPLAPQRAPAVPRGAPPRAEPEVRPTPADIMARLSNLAAAPPRSPARPELQRPSPALERPAAEPRSRQNPNMFDALWPAEQRAPRHSQPEAIARAPRLEARPEPRIDTRAEPKLEVPPEPKHEPRLEPPKPREHAEPATTPPGAEMRPIAILKSGVIDGMAYTLYTDGSIEAELPQGTMRFGSIDELRTHLENAER